MREAGNSLASLAFLEMICMHGSREGGQGVGTPTRKSQKHRGCVLTILVQIL